jgi:thiol-disulfide isomerase/thioredoxin
MELMPRIIAVLLLLFPLSAPVYSLAGIPGAQAGQADHAGVGPTRLSGTLVGSDGSPISVSHVHVHQWPGGHVLASAVVASDGTWTLDVDTTGVFLVWFSGVGHRGERAGLFLSGDEQRIDIDVQLGRHELRDELDGAALIGDFNEFAEDRGTLPLHSRADGLRAIDVATEADTLAYQLLGVAWTSPIEDPHARRYVYDGSGGYRSIVDVDRSFTTIVLDPTSLESGSGAGEVWFSDPSSPAGRFGLFTRHVFDRVDAYFERRARAAASGASITEMRAIYDAFDPAPDAEMVANALATEPDPELRDIMLVIYMAAPIKTDPATARASLEELPPASPAWLVQPSGLSKGLSATDDRDRSREYALAVLRSPELEGGRSDKLRPVALAWLLEDALARGSSDELEAYHAWLISEYPDSDAAGKAEALYAPDRLIQPGSRIPDFEIHSLDDPSVTYTRADLAGRVVMLDFWATWCGPCISEMPYMHEAYEKYTAEGFTILSLSFDLAREDVDRFRSEGDWPMPWLHVFVEEGAESEFATSMDVVNIPRAILIGRDGTILATNESLRGERLDETLSRVLRGED